MIYLDNAATTLYKPPEVGQAMLDALQTAGNPGRGAHAPTLHASRVGGFSWACPGVDGGRGKPTRLSGFSGFDYVLNPGFSSNRGYILEGAADTAGKEQMILECLAATV